MDSCKVVGMGWKGFTSCICASVNALTSNSPMFPFNRITIDQSFSLAAISHVSMKAKVKMAIIQILIDTFLRKCKVITC